MTMPTPLLVSMARLVEGQPSPATSGPVYSESGQPSAHRCRDRVWLAKVALLDQA